MQFLKVIYLQEVRRPMRSRDLSLITYSIRVARSVFFPWVCGCRLYCSLNIVEAILIFIFFQGSAFLQNFRSSDQNRFADAWDDVQTPQMPLFQGRNGLNNIPFEHSQVQPNLEGEINLSINCMYTHSRTCFFCLFPDKCKNNHPCLI